MLKDRVNSASDSLKLSVGGRPINIPRKRLTRVEFSDLGILFNGRHDGARILDIKD